VKLSRVAVAGATGYSGQELVQLLSKHPHFKLAHRIGREDALASLKGQIDLAFLCTPNETSLEMARELLALGIHVVDVSGAFRLKKHDYPQWYGFEHTAPELLARSEYALYPWRKTEPVREGQPARLIANPGCYPTATLLALIPLVRSGLVRPESLYVDAKSGTTGAGRKGEVKLLFSEIYGEFAPYKVGRHQHWPEIVEAVESFAGVAINPVFVTELLPVERGISVAVFGEWKDDDVRRDPDRLAKLQAAFATAYEGQPDISTGAGAELASLKAVTRTNRAHIQIQEAFGRPVIFSVIDNLLRGAAGQALMNANQLAGLPAQTGLLP
jgi:N-acetyl-gamma-glutamyl-phosphate reductase